MLKFKQIDLPIRPISKPRPRSFMGQKRPYNPPQYKSWLKEAKVHLKEQWKLEPLTKVHRLDIFFRGAEMGDLDNKSGSVMDAAKNILWTDDSVKVIPNLNLSFTKVKIKDSHIIIQITWEVDDD
tara:strand:- start:740 stop:1114 length:375 start_codon:yes stop_codon:yes gene_type:complete